MAQFAQVLDHIEGMRIHGIDVEQVVLHLADHAAELGQVTAKNAVTVHAAQVHMHTLGTAEQLDEQAGVARILAEIVINQVAMVA